MGSIKKGGILKDNAFNCDYFKEFIENIKNDIEIEQDYLNCHRESLIGINEDIEESIKKIKDMTEIKDKMESLIRES